MDNIRIVKVFSDEDREFNRNMVRRAAEKEQKPRFLGRRGGKMPMTEGERILYTEREYDFTSEVLAEFRRKWGIKE